jgi:hypothetical protein
MPRPFSLPSLLLAGLAVAQSVPDPVAATLMRAGDNRPELERAWRDVPDGDRAALRFVLEHLPERDATTLTAPFLLDDVRLAHALDDRGEDERDEEREDERKQNLPAEEDDQDDEQREAPPCEELSRRRGVAKPRIARLATGWHLSERGAAVDGTRDSFRRRRRGS